MGLPLFYSKDGFLGNTVVADGDFQIFPSRTFFKINGRGTFVSTSIGADTGKEYRMPALALNKIRNIKLVDTAANHRRALLLRIDMRSAELATEVQFDTYKRKE